MPCVVTTPTMEHQPPHLQGGALFKPVPAPQSRPAPGEASASMDPTLRRVMQGLQLSRASTLSLMRMQLAVRSGERMQAMAAMDRLDALDAELERLIAQLPAPDSNDPGWQAIAKHIEEQKLALAFEKLALASGIVGPDMVSIEEALPGPAEQTEQPADPALWEPVEPLPDMPELAAVRAQAEEFAPERSRGISSAVLGLALTLAIAAGATAAAWYWL